MSGLIKKVGAFILISAMFSACGKTQSENSSLENNLKLKFLSASPIRNEKILRFISEYIKTYSDGPPRIYTLLIAREDLVTMSAKISSINTYGELNGMPPQAYFELDGELIAVYTGLEMFLDRDEKFIAGLKNTIGERLSNDMLADGKTRNPDFQYKMYDPATWEIKIFPDSAKITRDVLNPLGPPLTNLKFITPKRQKN